MTHQGQLPEVEKGRAIDGDLNVGPDERFSPVYTRLLPSFSSSATFLLIFFFFFSSSVRPSLEKVLSTVHSF